MKLHSGRIVLLAAMFALAISITGFAQQPCPVANQIICQGQDGTGVLYASQNDTTGGNGNFATTYQQFSFGQTIDVESFHWVGGYFNPPTQAPITGWALNIYGDNKGVPDLLNTIFGTKVLGTGGETFIGTFNGTSLYQYALNFNSFDINKGTYWASVVPDLGFPPQWGWATSGGANNNGYQCFFGECASIGTGLAFGIDGVPEPGMPVMLGTGILLVAGALRRKLL
jgi:hypothetical protein